MFLSNWWKWKCITPPRNKGIELATTPFITFLDPDNEAVNEGYTKLYQSIIEQDVDIVIGNIIKADKNCREVNYFKSVYECFPQQNIFTQQHAAEILLDTSFKSQSIQAMMMKKSFLLERKLKMVEGVVGEDTLYFWEVLYNAQSFATINEIIHIYFAGVEGSSVNNITLQTFLKYKKIEERKLEFLQNHSLLDEYLALRFSYYFNNWYLKKWNRMKEYDKDQAKEVLKDILEMYLPYMQEHQKHEWHLLMR
ncbi:glycosyltransferase [Gracilibacillus boraciitolerans]|uniref:glycosyltransferase n=1 Tax=Gracilibacillus boraciitolerans TaxID=307521 RepID=UPI000A037C37